MKSENFGVGCMILFATPFAGVGVFMIFLLCWSAFDYGRMRSWTETPATILEVGMERSDDTQQLVADYEYTVDGTKYNGSRVAINEMSDNVSDFHDRKYRELKAAKDKKQPFPCFVNPSNPAESILFPQLRWEMMGIFTLFGLVFGGAGFGIMGGAIYARGKLKDQSAREFQHPEQPWLWRSDWADGYVNSDNKATTFALMAFAGFWNLIAWPVSLLVVPQELADGNRWVLLIGIFPAIGLLLVYFTVMSLLRWRKYGQPRFQMASTPGLIGGPLAGAVVGKNLENALEFHQTLACIRSTKDSDGDSKQETIFQTKRVVDKKMPTGETGLSAVPVLFHIPYDCRPTTMDDGPDVKWQLELKAETPGVDFHSTFEVPVFKTEASSRDYKADDSLIADYAKPDAPDNVFARAQLGRRVEGNTLHVSFGFGRNIGATMALFIFTCIWTGVVCALVSFEAPILFPIIFGLIDLFLVWALVDSLFWTSRFEVDSQGLRGRFGIFPRWREFNAEDIKKILLRRNTQAGNNIYYEMRLKIRSGKDFVIGKGLLGYSDASYVAKELMAAMKMDSEGMLEVHDYAEDDDDEEEDPQSDQ